MVLPNLLPTSGLCVAESRDWASRAFELSPEHAVRVWRGLGPLRKRRPIAIWPVRQALVVREGDGIANLYQLNREHLLAGPVLEIARAREILRERATAHISTWTVQPLPREKSDGPRAAENRRTHLVATQRRTSLGSRRQLASSERSVAVAR